MYTPVFIQKELDRQWRRFCSTHGNLSKLGFIRLVSEHAMDTLTEKDVKDFIKKALAKALVTQTVREEDPLDLSSAAL